MTLLTAGCGGAPPPPAPSTPTAPTALAYGDVAGPSAPQSSPPVLLRYRLDDGAAYDVEVTSRAVTHSGSVIETRVTAAMVAVTGEGGQALQTRRMTTQVREGESEWSPAQATTIPPADEHDWFDERGFRHGCFAPSLLMNLEAPFPDEPVSPGSTWTLMADLELRHPEIEDLTTMAACPDRDPAVPLELGSFVEDDSGVQRDPVEIACTVDDVDERTIHFSCRSVLEAGGMTKHMELHAEIDLRDGYSGTRRLDTTSTLEGHDGRETDVTTMTISPAAQPPE